MILRVPSYYNRFRCIADGCKDSCCIGWEIDIDEDTFSYYKSVGGSFGRRLRAHMATDEYNSFTLQENGWCPFLNKEKLCDICIELGEEALCEVCTEFPRFTMEYENVREKVLCLSCEEVGRLVFSTDEKITWEEHITDNTFEDWEEAPVAAPALERVRAHAVSILQNREKPVFVRAAEYLCHCEEKQRELYGGVAAQILTDGERSAGTKAPAAGNVCKEQTPAEAYRDFLARMELYSRLEVLDETWTREKQALLFAFTEENYLKEQRLFLKKFREREYEYEHLLVYFTNRYFMRAYYDANILNKAKLAVASVLFIRDMDVLCWRQTGAFTLQDRIGTAKLYAKETEHSEENMELLADAFQFGEVFETERLLKQL